MWHQNLSVKPWKGKQNKIKLETFSCGLLFQVSNSRHAFVNFFQSLGGVCVHVWSMAGVNSCKWKDELSGNYTSQFVWLLFLFILACVALMGVLGN